MSADWEDIYYQMPVHMLMCINCKEVFWDTLQEEVFCSHKCETEWCDRTLSTEMGEEDEIPF